MIQEVRTYVCDDIPSREDILEAIEIVKKENFIIRLTWFVQYSGRYNIMIYKDSTLSSVMEGMPKEYAV